MKCIKCKGKMMLCNWNGRELYKCNKCGTLRSDPDTILEADFTVYGYDKE